LRDTPQLCYPISFQNAAYAAYAAFAAKRNKPYSLLPFAFPSLIYTKILPSLVTIEAGHYILVIAVG
jgi:hypothetical protein